MRTLIFPRYMADFFATLVQGGFKFLCLKRFMRHFCLLGIKDGSFLFHIPDIVLLLTIICFAYDFQG